MSDKQQQYRVVADGHIHADKALKQGDVVTLRKAVVARYPKVFEPIPSTPSARGAASKE